jgi:undecaprenyl-diphosphatase
VDLLAAALLGIVQGLTEFLPISSTGHLLITERLVGFHDESSLFTVTIQFGSVLAVMWLYREKLLSVLRGLPSDPEARRFAFMVLLAFVPAAIVAKFFGDDIKQVLHGSLEVIAWAFIVGGIVILVVERFQPAPIVFSADRTPMGRAVAVGCCQALALVPGVSRSGATIIGGLLFGLERKAAAEFSFFLAMPTMGAAFAHDMWDVRHSLSADRAAEIGVGFVLAFVAAALVVKPFLEYVGRSGFAPFAWYRIAAGIALLAAIAAGWM